MRKQIASIKKNLVLSKKKRSQLLHQHPRLRMVGFTLGQTIGPTGASDQRVDHFPRENESYEEHRGHSLPHQTD